MKAQGGLTLIELMVVAMIIGILAATIIPQHQNYATCSEGALTLAMIDPLRITVEESLSCGTAGNKIKTDTTASTVAETYVDVVPGTNKLGIIAVAIEDSGVDDISFTLQTSTSSPRNATKAITLSRIAGDVWTCKSTQDEVFIPKGCTKQNWISVSGGAQVATSHCDWLSLMIGSHPPPDQFSR